MLVVLDNYSDFSALIPVATKSNAIFEAFTHLVTLWECHTARHLQCIQHDCGGEFVNAAFDAWLAERNIP